MDRDNLMGLRISFELISRINEEQTKPKKQARNQRRNKFNRAKKAQGRRR